MLEYKKFCPVIGPITKLPKLVFKTLFAKSLTEKRHTLNKRPPKNELAYNNNIIITVETLQ
jgi:hypothetical protein